AVHGSAYDDFIRGNADNNAFSSLYGNDTLIGGGGNDRFQIQTRLLELIKDTAGLQDLIGGIDHLYRLNLVSPEAKSILDFRLGDSISFADPVRRVGPLETAAPQVGDLRVVPIPGGAALQITRSLTPDTDLTISLPGVHPNAVVLSQDGYSVTLAAAPAGSKVDLNGSERPVPLGFHIYGPHQFWSNENQPAQLQPAGQNPFGSAELALAGGIRSVLISVDQPGSEFSGVPLLWRVGYDGTTPNGQPYTAPRMSFSGTATQRDVVFGWDGTQTTLSFQTVARQTAEGTHYDLKINAPSVMPAEAMQSLLRSLAIEYQANKPFVDHRIQANLIVQISGDGQSFISAGPTEAGVVQLELDHLPPQPRHAFHAGSVVFLTFHSGDLAFTEMVDGDRGYAHPPASLFSVDVKVNGVADHSFTVEQVAMSQYLVLELNKPVPDGGTVTVSYRDPIGNQVSGVLQNWYGTDTRSGSWPASTAIDLIMRNEALPGATLGFANDDSWPFGMYSIDAEGAGVQLDSPFEVVSVDRDKGQFTVEFHPSVLYPNPSYNTTAAAGTFSTYRFTAESPRVVLQATADQRVPNPGESLSLRDLFRLPAEPLVVEAVQSIWAAQSPDPSTDAVTRIDLSRISFVGTTLMPLSAAFVSTDSPSRDIVIGSNGRDTLQGGWGADSIRGLGGDDQIDGGPDHDSLGGGPGNDTIVGGSGDDHFVYNVTITNGQDEIVDFGKGADQLRVLGTGGVAPVGTLSVGGDASALLARQATLSYMPSGDALFYLGIDATPGADLSVLLKGVGASSGTFSVQSDGEISWVTLQPSQASKQVPYALHAGHAGDVVALSFGQDGRVYAPIITPLRDGAPDAAHPPASLFEVRVVIDGWIDTGYSVVGAKLDRFAYLTLNKPIPTGAQVWVRYTDPPGDQATAVVQTQGAGIDAASSGWIASIEVNSTWSFTALPGAVLGVSNQREWPVGTYVADLDGTGLQPESRMQVIAVNPADRSYSVQSVPEVFFSNPSFNAAAPAGSFTSYPFTNESIRLDLVARPGQPLPQLNGIVLFGDLLESANEPFVTAARSSVVAAPSQSPSANQVAWFDLVDYDIESSQPLPWAFALQVLPFGRERLVGGASADTLEGVWGMDVLDGLAGNDKLLGGEGDDQLIGGPGNDTLDGGAGNWNQAAYAFPNASSGVSFTISVPFSAATGRYAGLQPDGLGGTDTLINISSTNIFGTPFNDSLTGGAGVDVLTGGLGSDTLDGGSGSAAVFYLFASGAVTVDLGAGTSSGADGADTLRNVHGVIGSAYGDTLRGNDFVRSNGVSNFFRPGPGNDTMEGRGGEDIYRFETRPYNLERDFGWAIDRLQANHLRSINLSISETDTILDFSAQDLIEFEDSVTRVSSSTAPSALKSGELLIAPVNGGTALYIGRDQTVGVDLTVLLPGIQPASLTLQSDGMKLKIGSSVDTTPPQIALSANRLELKADETAQIQFTLSEPVNDFTLSDVAVSGGSLTGLSGSGASYTATFTPAPNSDATVAMLSVADGFVSDAAGLFNQDGGSATNALLINIDTQTPRLTAVSPADQASNVPINSNLVFTFSEAVQRSNGSITLTHASDPSANRSFSVTDTSQVSIDRNTLIINPVELLKPNAHYAITMSPGALSDLAGNPLSGLRAADGYDFHTASASSMGALEGIAYHWRSHELLESVNVMVAEEVAPLGSNLVAPIRFVPIRWDAAGQATMEVWSHPTLASESFDLQIRIEGANSIDFTPGQALSGWVVESNSVGGRLDAGGFAISASQGLTTDPTPIGTLTFETTAIDRTTLHLDYGAAGALVGTAFSQTLARADTDPNGEFIIGDLDLGLYQLSATRAPLTVASSITS
ncbi:MAG: toxin determinant from serotypes 1/9, partial [Pseudomonadota bacterium]